MLLIYLIVNYLHRKYGAPLHNFVENWTRGISHLKGLFVNTRVDSVMFLKANAGRLVKLLLRKSKPQFPSM